MATIIGVRSSSFKGNDEVEVMGKNIYFTEPLERGRVSSRTGYSSPRISCGNASMIPRSGMKYTSSITGSVNAPAFTRRTDQANGNQNVVRLCCVPITIE